VDEGDREWRPSAETRSVDGVRIRELENVSAGGGIQL
jgi:hypothetical protein